MHRLHHVGYWVNDLDSAQAQWDQDLDVGPFQENDVITGAHGRLIALRAAAGKDIEPKASMP
jgi:hypothetical protein